VLHVRLPGPGGHFLLRGTALSLRLGLLHGQLRAEAGVRGGARRGERPHHGRLRPDRHLERRDLSLSPGPRAGLQRVPRHHPRLRPLLSHAGGGGGGGHGLPGRGRPAGKDLLLRRAGGGLHVGPRGTGPGRERGREPANGLRHGLRRRLRAGDVDRRRRGHGGPPEAGSPLDGGLRRRPHAGRPPGVPLRPPGLPLPAQQLRRRHHRRHPPLGSLPPPRLLGAVQPGTGLRRRGGGGQHRRRRHLDGSGPRRGLPRLLRPDRLGPHQRLRLPPVPGLLLRPRREHRSLPVDPLHP